MSTNRPSEFITCPRCHGPLTYGGTKQFHEGTRAWDFLGGIFELFKHREAFDLYACGRCGRVELFLDGVGEELRGESAEPRNILLEPPPAEPATGDDWQCSRCGERVPGNFDTCWKCQQPRVP